MTFLCDKHLCAVDRESCTHKKWTIGCGHVWWRSTVLTSQTLHVTCTVIAKLHIEVRNRYFSGTGIITSCNMSSRSPWSNGIFMKVFLTSPYNVSSFLFFLASPVLPYCGVWRNRNAPLSRGSLLQNPGFGFWKTQDGTLALHKVVMYKALPPIVNWYNLQGVCSQIWEPAFALIPTSQTWSTQECLKTATLEVGELSLRCHMFVTVMDFLYKVRKSITRTPWRRMPELHQVIAVK